MDARLKMEISRGVLRRQAKRAKVSPEKLAQKLAREKSWIGRPPARGTSW